MNPVTTSACYNQVTGLMPDFRTASSTCESYYSADAADQVVVGWSCSDNAKGLVYVWGGGDDGTVSCNSEKHFLCVTTPGFPDLPVDEKCPSAAMASHPEFNTVLGDMGHVTCTKVPTFKKDPCQDPAEIIIILNNIYIKLIKGSLDEKLPSYEVLKMPRE